MNMKRSCTLLFFVMFNCLAPLNREAYGIEKNQKFSGALLRSSAQEGAQAERVVPSAPDSGEGMAGEVLKRLFVYRGDPKKAFFLSLLIPGWGQHYVKSRKSTRFFAVIEAAMWGAMIGHNLSARWAKENYKGFAADHSMAMTRGKDAQYFVNIGNFPDIYQYNHKKQVDRNVDVVYPVTSDYFWAWDSDENRRRFRTMRIDADATKNRAVYFGAGIMINHLISAIHATLVAKQGKPTEGEELSSNFRAGIAEDPLTGSSCFVVAYQKRW